MKEIAKAQVIDLMNALKVDGVDNSHSVIVTPVTARDSQELLGGDISVTLQPGAYCVIYSGEADLSDFPSVQKWINTKLTEDNIEIIPNGDYSMFVICLDLL